MNQPLVILDRDGVINEDSADYIKSVDEFVPIAGSVAAIAALSEAGYRVAVATNQSGLARGYFDEHTLALMHEKLHALVEAEGGRIEAVFVCPHGPDEGCACRKPATGMLEQMEQEFGQPVTGAWFIGDSLKDLDCAQAKGCQPALVLTGKGQQTLAGLSAERRQQTPVFADLATAVTHLLAEQH